MPRAIVAAILAVPWTLIGFRLWVEPTPMGTSPSLRYCTYFIAFALTVIAISGAVFDA